MAEGWRSNAPFFLDRKYVIYRRRNRYSPSIRCFFHGCTTEHKPIGQVSLPLRIVLKLTNLFLFVRNLFCYSRPCVTQLLSTVLG